MRQTLPAVTGIPMNTPTKICNSCARQLCGFYIDGRYVGPALNEPKYRMAKCDVCSIKDAVTDPLNHGGMVKNWQKLLNR